MLKNPFGSRTPLSDTEYQAHVLSLLRDHLPDERFQPTDDPLVIRYGVSQLGLQSLYSAYMRDGLSNRDRDASIREHFTRLVRSLAIDRELREMHWAEIQPLLRPQFMPPEYADRIPVLTFPFTDDVAIALVTDYSETYSYVRVEDGERWSQTPAALYDVAIANLNSASAEIEMHICDGPDRWLGIEVKDGYDAARLLLPGIRTYATERLGTPCFAVIPNRDFLFFWAATNSPRFQAFAREKARLDHRVQPYPLTDTVFTITAHEVAPNANA